ncbi:hypothetical protein ACWD4Z_34535 [Streptomyces antibioticus]
MGNASRPGSIVVREIDHAVFMAGNGRRYCIRELHWNGIAGRSYDLVCVDDDECLTEESFGEYPTDAQIAEVFDEHCIDVEWEMCRFCHEDILAATAHRYRNGWVGTCCWDEKLRHSA